MRRYIKKYAASVIWLSMLGAVFFMNTEDGTSLCLSKAIGAGACPGCGLGHAMHEALHLHFTASLQAHILGIPAVLILLYQFFKSIHTKNKNYYYGSTTTF